MMILRTALFEGWNTYNLIWARTFKKMAVEGSSPKRDASGPTLTLLLAVASITPPTATTHTPPKPPNSFIPLLNIRPSLATPPRRSSKSLMFPPRSCTPTRKQMTCTAAVEGTASIVNTLFESSNPLPNLKKKGSSLRKLQGWAAREQYLKKALHRARRWAITLLINSKRLLQQLLQITRACNTRNPHLLSWSPNLGTTSFRVKFHLLHPRAPGFP